MKLRYISAIKYLQGRNQIKTGRRGRTDRELRRLSRRELLEMLIEQMNENEELKQKLDRAESELKDRNIMIENAGSLAEATLKLNDVFEAADRAAQQYHENVRRMAEEGNDVS